MEPFYSSEDTSVYSGTPLFQHPGVRTPLYTVEPLYSNTLEWGHLCIQWNPSIPTPWSEDRLCIQWNPSIPTPWSEDTSVYSGTPLFQHPGVRTPLYTVEPLYSNTLEWGHLYSGIPAVHLQLILQEDFMEIKSWQQEFPLQIWEMFTWCRFGETCKKYNFMADMCGKCLHGVADLITS